MKKIYLTSLLILSASIRCVYGCFTPEYCYTVAVSSFGDYDLHGKTFFITSGNDTVSNEDVEFQYYRDMLTQCLIQCKAIPTNDSANADLRISTDYGIDLPGESFTYTISVPVITAMPDPRINFIRTDSKTFRFFHRFINVKAYDNHSEKDVMLWNTNGESVGVTDDFADAFPAIAQAMVPKFGKNNTEEECVRIYCSSPDIANMKQGVYLQEQVTVNPTNWSDKGQKSTRNDIIVRAVRTDNDTSIVLLQVVGTESLLRKTIRITQNTYLIHNDEKYSLAKVYIKAKGLTIANTQENRNLINRNAYVVNNMTEIKLYFPARLREGETVELVAYKDKKERRELFHFHIVLE